MIAAQKAIGAMALSGFTCPTLPVTVIEPLQCFPWRLNSHRAKRPMICVLRTSQQAEDLGSLSRVRPSRILPKTTASYVVSDEASFQLQRLIVC